MLVKNIRTTERQKLQELIPLDTPFSLTIDPCNMCNFSCQFCPTSDKELLNKVGRKSGVMSKELFFKIIDDSTHFKKRFKKIFFHKDGEPLLNKDLPEMIKYAKEKNVAEEYWITTNGSMLNEELSLKLIDSGLDLIRISVEAVSNVGYKSISKIDFDYNKLIKNVEFLYKNRNKCRIYAKILDWGLDDKEKEKFINDFKDITTEVSIDNLSGWTYSELKDFTLGQQPEKSSDNEELINKEVCPYPFYNMVINYDGTVSMCCCDWSHNTIVGDATIENLYDIWKGEKIFEFRKMHLEKQRHQNLACKTCYSIKSLPDNIDKYANEILQRLEKFKES